MDKIGFIHPAGTWNYIDWGKNYVTFLDWYVTENFLWQKNISYFCANWCCQWTPQEKIVQVMNFLYHPIWLYCWCVAWRQINFLIALCKTWSWGEKNSVLWENRTGKISCGQIFLVTIIFWFLIFILCAVKILLYFSINNLFCLRWLSC